MKSRSILALCAIYNRATSPSKMRTDHGHARARVLARLARDQAYAQYRYGIDWRESDHSGRYVAAGRQSRALREGGAMIAPTVTFRVVENAGYRAFYDVLTDGVVTSHMWLTHSGAWFECPAGNTGDVRAVATSGLERVAP